jgi:hypothetical protein
LYLFWVTPIPGSSLRPVAIGLSAAALALLAACSSGSSGSVASTGAAGTTGAAASSGTGSAASGSAGSALLAAATGAQSINSAVTTLRIQVSGSQASTETGTLQYQRTPSLMSQDMHIAAEGGNTEIKMILTGTDMYFSEPGLPTGKTWMKFGLAALKGKSASFAQLIQSMQSNNFTNQAQLFAVAKDAHVVGQATIDGVATTEYAGSFKASDAVKELSPAVRNVLGTQLTSLGDSTVSFREWIDGQHHMRQVIENETVKGHAVTTTMNVTAINEPVKIALPAASDVTSS